MKKRSQWIYILSVLMCLTMLFASCTNVPADTDTDTGSDTVISEQATTEEITEPAQTEPEIPEDEKVDYASKIAGWIKYFQKIDDKTELKSSIEHLFNMNQDDESRYVTTTSNYIVVTDTYREDYYDMNGYDQARVRRSYTVYSMNSGAQISFTDYQYDTGVNPNADKYYRISELNSSSGILAVTCYTATYTYPEMPDGSVGMPERVHVPTYTYYDANLDVIASDLEQPLSTTDAYMHDGYFTFEMDGKYHVFAKGIKFYEYDVTRGVIIPEVSASFEGYSYIYTMNGSYISKIMVVDSDYRTVIEYDVSSVYTDASWYLLGNGNILIQGLTDMDDDRAQYDIELGNKGTKVNVDHVLINVKEATVTEIELGYVIDKLVNNLSDNAGFELKEEFASFQYAEIYKTGDKGTYIWSEANKIIPVVLDDALAIKQELELVVKDQTGFAGINEDGKLLFYADTFGGSDVYSYYCSYCDRTLSENEVWEYYGTCCRYCDSTVQMTYIGNDADIYYADPENNTVGLYIDTADGAYTKVNGGFIYNGKLYNNDCQEIYDLVDVDRYYGVKNGVVYIYTKKVPADPADSYDKDQISPYVSFTECSIVDGKAVLVGDWYYNPNKDSFTKKESFTFIYRGADSENAYPCVEVYNASGEFIKLCSSVSFIRTNENCSVVRFTVNAETDWPHYEYYIIK